MRLIAQVRPVRPAHACHRNQLLGAREASGRIDQRARQAHRALIDGLLHDRFHPPQLLGIRRAIGVAEDHLARVRGADVEGEVERGAALLDDAHELAEGVPCDAWPAVRFGALHFREHRVVLRSGRVTFARDLGGHALPHLPFELRIDEHRGLRVAEQIDEARRNDMVRRVERRRRGGLREVADRRDRVAANADVRARARRAGTVDDVAAADDDVKVRTSCGQRGRRVDRLRTGEREECDRQHSRRHGSPWSCKAAELQSCKAAKLQSSTASEALQLCSSTAVLLKTSTALRGSRCGLAGRGCSPDRRRAASVPLPHAAAR
jgi:hypothetical protein